MWDVFISHASEDKQDVIEPLARILEGYGLSVWYDKTVLTLGDSLRRRIDEGLARSRFGVVILSRHFFAKNWPQRELDALVARESDGEKVILPIWHGVAKREILRYSPLLADRLAVSTKHGLETVAQEILRAVRSPQQVGVAVASERAELSELAAKITFEHPGPSRHRVQAFTAIALKSASSIVRADAVQILKGRLGFVASEQGASAAVRRLRQEVFRGIRALAPPTLGSCFSNGELEGGDLYGIDFSGSDLGDVSFRGAFLVEADFSAATLHGADFTRCYLRNSNFANASLKDATLTAADWFNAVGFTENQLAAARRDTVAPCPKGLRALKAFLRTKYGFSLETWEPRLQSQLREAWQSYSANARLRNAIAEWNR